ncbi:siderophore-interacting protein [Microbacterium sp. NC79]|uniref:siderophore-interacting protein n=1 Tax=Microbacterium sp. NC79 TaxID=2851009 RepID=UPI001C2BE1FC|nr:siderophore-interacting protein [Microbacterium sp. NC79]MBV0895909.1 siderophore-interacting protein [Microbacterium sp. NC79]
MTTEQTALFHRELIRHELVLRHLQVTAVQRIAPDMVRLTVGGADLAGFMSNGAADHIKLFLPNPETGVITTPKDGNPAAVISRDFTPLIRETANGTELDLDFYTHVNPGPAASFALNATPGSALVIGGPRGSRSFPAGVERLIVVADETAMPSASRWVADAPAGAEVFVIATVSGDGAWVQNYVGDRATVIVTANAAEPAIAALTEIGITDTTFVFVAGNAANLITVRRHLRRALALPAAQVAVSGYWRTGVVAWDHHAPIDPMDPDDE